MAIVNNNYNVKVELNPNSFPQTDKNVIWDTSSGSFALGGQVQTTGTTVEFLGPDSADVVYSLDITTPNLNIDYNTLKGELFGIDSGGQHYQTARVVVSWLNHPYTTNNTTARIVVENNRYPENRVLYNINNFTVSWDTSDYNSFGLRFYQYVPPTAATQPSYKLNYILF
tara:strand:+ start:743 stop:1252 length:510 start_codon:yes stop_codon:yes gene_type:complete